MFMLTGCGKNGYIETSTVYSFYNNNRKVTCYDTRTQYHCGYTFYNCDTGLLYRCVGNVTVEITRTIVKEK